MGFEQGPYIQFAAFCEKVLTEQDGVLSLIRVIDRVTHTRTEPDAPEDLPPFNYQMTLAISLKAGKATGRHQLKLERRLPSGEIDPKTPPAEIPVFLEGENRGANVVVGVVGGYEVEGVYWYNLYFDSELLTRVPFEVRYARLVMGR